MKRSEIDNKYKWHLDDLVASDEKWEQEFKAIEARLPEIKNFEGKLAGREELLACLKLSAEFGLELEVLYCYARMKKDENSSLDKYVSMTDRIDGLVVKYSTYSSYIESEISKIDKNKLGGFIADPEFADFDFMLSEILRMKKYILSDREERLLAMSQSSLGMFQETFQMIDYVDLALPEIKVDGKKEKLTHGTYSYFLQSKNPKTRKAAFEGMYSAFKALINTIAANYGGSVKADNFYASARGYKSCLDKALYVDDVPPAVYNNLIKYVGKNIKKLHKYVALRKKALGGKTLHMYDMHVSIVEDKDLSISYEEAYKLVMEGLKPLGNDYGALLAEARDKGWIDVMESENKRSGAYSWGAYGTHPYVLLNYTKTTHDVFTIAHEMGHALHSYHSDKALPYIKAGYKIFVAEVASTVNEVLLLKHLINTTQDKAFRKYLLSYYLDMFRTTMFRQTMFAEFEKNAHEMEQNGQPLTVTSMSDMYYELNKKYYGRSVKHDDDIRYEWARIPHFYNAFYVYKYSTGIISAINIVKRILEDPSHVKQYKQFLSSGGSNSPYEILKAAGVDLATKDPYETAMNEFSETLELLTAEFEN